MKTTILLCAVINATLVLGSCANQSNRTPTLNPSGVAEPGAIGGSGVGGGGSAPGQEGLHKLEN
jgi:hypothetical protein